MTLTAAEINSNIKYYLEIENMVAFERACRLCFDLTGSAGLKTEVFCRNQK